MISVDVNCEFNQPPQQTLGAEKSCTAMGKEQSIGDMEEDCQSAGVLVSTRKWNCLAINMCLPLDKGPRI